MRIISFILMSFLKSIQICSTKVYLSRANVFCRDNSTPR